jgi:hypothetical protein
MIRFIENEKTITARRLKERFDSLCSDECLTNVFNPSFYHADSLEVLSWRAIRQGENDLSAFVSVNGNTFRLDDLAKELNEPRLIDPKVFPIGEDVYITFNTGIGNGKTNNIYVMKVFPTIERPKIVHYSRRQPQERNWAFYKDPVCDAICVLYKIGPTVILEVKNPDADSWELVEQSIIFNRRLPRYSIGTQVAISGNEGTFVAHHKPILHKKKLYFGKLCTFDFDFMCIKDCNPSQDLFHNLESLFGSNIKHNTNLLACTYFSGAEWINGELILGYGINDVDMNIISMGKTIEIV